MAKQTTNTKAADAVREAQAEAVRLQEERDRETPTPTQEDLDRLNRGEPIGDGTKTDDAAEQPAESATRSAVADGAAPYKTRDAKAT